MGVGECVGAFWADAVTSPPLMNLHLIYEADEACFHMGFTVTRLLGAEETTKQGNQGLVHFFHDMDGWGRVRKSLFGGFFTRF